MSSLLGGGDYRFTGKGISENRCSFKHIHTFTSEWTISRIGVLVGRGTEMELGNRVTERRPQFETFKIVEFSLKIKLSVRAAASTRSPKLPYRFILRFPLLTNSNRHSYLKLIRATKQLFLQRKQSTYIWISISMKGIMSYDQFMPISLVIFPNMCLKHILSTAVFCRGWDVVVLKIGAGLGSPAVRTTCSYFLISTYSPSVYPYSKTFFSAAFTRDSAFYN